MARMASQPDRRSLSPSLFRWFQHDMHPRQTKGGSYEKPHLKPGYTCNIIHEQFEFANFILCTSLSGRWSHMLLFACLDFFWGISFVWNCNVKFSHGPCCILQGEHNNPTLGWGSSEKKNTKRNIAFQKRVKCMCSRVTIYMHAHYTIPNWDRSSFPNHLFFKIYTSISIQTEIDQCSRGANDKTILKMFKFEVITWLYGKIL
jgi:hypothetical protein